jgi:hypothetical protein
MDATICLLIAILLIFFSNCCHLCLTSFGVTLSRFEATYKKRKAVEKIEATQWKNARTMN